MTYHAIRIKTSTSQEDNPSVVPQPEPPALETVLPDRVTQNIKNKFTGRKKHADIVARKFVNPTGKTTHIKGVYRFDSSHDLNTLISKIESEVVADCKWYKIEYHECYFDGRCGDWQVKAIKGNVPGDL